MEKLKIVINGNDHTASKAKELFSKLGYYISSQNRNNAYGWSLGDGVGDYYGNKKSFDKDVAREITIQELRDIVVLKRNSVDDANYTCDREKKYYITGNDVYMYIHQGVWSLCEKFPLEKAIEHWKLKPIKKEKTMKEWIYKDGSGKYVLTTDPEVANLAADAVEVPEGMNYAHKDELNIHFTKLEMGYRDSVVVWQRQPNQTTIDAMNDDKTEAFDTKEMCGGGSKPKHSHYKKDVSHLNVIDPYRISDLYGLHPCAEHIMKKSLCAGNRGHKDLLRDIQDIIDTAERWKEMIEEDSREV